MTAGGLDPLQPIVLPLREERPAIEPARVAQDHGHELHGDRRAGDRDDLLAEVDLHLLAGRGLEPDGGQGPGSRLLPQRRDGALQGAEVDVDPLLGQLLLNDDGIPLGDGLEEPLDFALGGRVETTRRGTFLEADRGPGAITADGVAGDPQLPSNPFAAQTLAGEFADQVHDIRLEHPTVLLRIAQADLGDVRRSHPRIVQVDQNRLRIVHHPTSTNVEEGGQF